MTEPPELAWNPDDVMVAMEHPFGRVEESLSRWMERGPGPRPLLRPVQAWSRSTGQALPLTVIPLPYRNDEQSLALIAEGKLAWPWPVRADPREPFDSTVADPAVVDAAAERVLALVGSGPVDAEVAGRVVELVADFDTVAAVVVRRLAAQRRWDDFARVVSVAGAARTVDAGGVLCEALESDLDPPDRGLIVDVLGQIRYPGALLALDRQLGRFEKVDPSSEECRRCLRAMAGLGTEGARTVLEFIVRGRSSEPIREYASHLLADLGNADFRDG